MVSAHGLAGAPLTRLWLYLVAAGTVVILSMNWRHYARLRIVPYVVRDWQLWRGVTSLVGFSTYTELCIGMLVIYRLRRVERLFGTRKYAAFLFTVGLVGQALCIGCVQLLLLTRRTLAAAVVANLSVAQAMGPYVLIFASLYQYHVHVPVQHRGAASFMGVSATDKWVVYGVAMAMWPSTRLGAIAPSLAGVAAACVYNANIAGLRDWRFPVRMTHVAQRLSSSLSQTSSGGSMARTQRMAAESMVAARNAAWMRGMQHLDHPDQNQAVEEPTEELIAQLQSMFPDAGRERVAQALQAGRNNPNRAAAIILGH